MMGDGDKSSHCRKPALIATSARAAPHRGRCDAMLSPRFASLRQLTSDPSDVARIGLEAKCSSCTRKLAPLQVGQREAEIFGLARTMLE